LWFLVPGWGQVFLWLDGTIAYSWQLTILLFFLVPYRKKSYDNLYTLKCPALLFFLLGIVAGNSTPNANAAVSILLLAYFGINIIQKRKIAFFEILGAAGFFIGFYFALSDPANFSRAATEGVSVLNSTNFSTEFPKRFISVTGVFVRHYGLLLMIISIILGCIKIFYQKKKLNLFTGFYFLAGIGSAYSMIVAPYFRDRSFLPVTVFLIIAILSVIEQMHIEITKKWKNGLCALFILSLIFSGGSFYLAFKDIMGFYEKWQDRTNYILQQKAKGILDIEVKAPIPTNNKHNGGYFQIDYQYNGEILQDSEYWSNVGVARYFGVNTIKGVENDAPWESK
jgi:hypothetical protein